MHEYPVEVEEIDGGFAFRVSGVYQPWHPEKEGFIRMTREEAEILGNSVAERMLAEDIRVKRHNIVTNAASVGIILTEEQIVQLLEV